MLTDPHTTAKVIAAYQQWASETITTNTRAESVMSGLLEMLAESGKTARIQWLIREGWVDTKAGAKRLVDAIQECMP